jgi:hypothetical protein
VRITIGIGTFQARPLISTMRIELNACMPANQPSASS